MTYGDCSRRVYHAADAGVLSVQEHLVSCQTGYNNNHNNNYIKGITHYHHNKYRSYIKPNSVYEISCSSRGIDECVTTTTNK